MNKGIDLNNLAYDERLQTNETADYAYYFLRIQTDNNGRPYDYEHIYEIIVTKQTGYMEVWFYNGEDSDPILILLNDRRTGVIKWANRICELSLADTAWNTDVNFWVFVMQMNWPTHDEYYNEWCERLKEPDKFWSRLDKQHRRRWIAHLQTIV